MNTLSFNETAMKELPLLKLVSEIFTNDHNLLIGPGDDCAAIKLNPEDDSLLLLAVDQLNPGVHYIQETASPKKIAEKLLKRNLSDIAAMGGNPSYALASLSFKQDTKQEFCVNLLKALAESAKVYDICVCGGDISKSLFSDCFSLTIVGNVTEAKIATRSGARDSDALFCTGLFGKSFETEHHFTFIPRLKEGAFLAGSFTKTMIDVSDGLLLDASRIAKKSKIGLKLFCDKIPLRANASLKNALTDGEDYELLFAVPLEKAHELEKIWTFSTPLTKIGVFSSNIPAGDVINEQGDALLNSNYCIYPLAGYEHHSP